MVSKALPLAPVQTVGGYPNRRQLADLLRSFEARICFLEFQGDGSEAFQTLETLHIVAPQLPIIGIVPPNKPDLLLECVRRGAADFLLAPITTEQLETSLTRVLRTIRNPAQTGNAGKTIAVVPAKSASGTTTAACGLAAALCKKAAPRTLLADLDPLTGTVSFLLKLKSSYSFLDVLQRSHQLDSDLWKQMVSSIQGMDVLLAPESVIDSGGELVSASPILEYARQSYDALVLDCSHTPSDWNLSIARASDDLLLMTTNDLLALHAAQRTLAWYEQCGIDMNKVKVVIGRHVSEGGLALNEIPNVLEREVFGVIPQDSDSVSKALMEGKPVQSATAFGKSLAQLAAKLMPNESGTEKKGSGGKGLLSSLFSRS